MSSSETQLPSTDSNDHRMSVVIQNPVFDLVNENESNVESIITDCDLPADLEEQLKACKHLTQHSTFLLWKPVNFH